MKKQDAFIGQTVGFLWRDIVYTGKIVDIFQTQDLESGEAIDWAKIETTLTHYEIQIKRLLGVL